jgi:hypothetical protein
MLSIRIIYLTSVVLLWSNTCNAQHSDAYYDLQQRIAKGWNSWSYGSMLAQVCLPEALSLQINFRESYIGSPYDPKYLYRDINLDKHGLVKPIAHTWDGSYSELVVEGWKGNSIRIQTASWKNDIVILVTPLRKSATKYFVELQTGILWNKPGSLKKFPEYIEAEFGDRVFAIRATQPELAASFHYASPYMVIPADTTVAFYTGEERSLDSLQNIIQNASKSYHQRALRYGTMSTAYEAIESVLGWNTIYDPDNNRVITPVSRGWNEAWQGYVLFGWDTYFASLLCGLGHKELAYSNAIAVTDGRNQEGAIGFFQMPRQIASQSQPPVGSMICWKLYEKYKEKWFLEEVYANLCSWNEWWLKHRLYKNYLSYGTSWNNAIPHHAALESGLDNSPMYDEVRMINLNEDAVMNLADVGLNSLYAADCLYLAKIAVELGKTSDAKKLSERAQRWRKQVATLWSDDHKIYLNKFTDSTASSMRLSPTLFYPMIADIPTREQFQYLMRSHYNNPREFYHQYMIPSCARNDKAFNNQYWQGAIWPPVNFLCYLGLRNYDKVEASRLAETSYRLFTTAWEKHQCVFENINSERGADRREDQLNCDPFYHWGALMGIMKFIDENKY